MRAWGLLLGVLALAGLSACGRGEGPEPAAEAAVPERSLSPAQLSFLKFGQVAEVDAFDLTDLSGTVEFDEQQTARLNAMVPGRVAEMLVQVGDRVTADQPLVALDSPEVRVVQAEYVRAEADLTLARRAASRAGRLRAA